MLNPYTAATGTLLIWGAVGMVWLWNGWQHERRQRAKHALEMLHAASMVELDTMMLQAMQRREARQSQQH